MKCSRSHLIGQLRKDTETLATPNGRRVGLPGHQNALEFLHGRMRSIGLAPFHNQNFRSSYRMTHPVTRKMQEFTNLIGVIPGRNRDLEPILLGAHYDSVIDAPCADDNATSVALNLAIAEEFEPEELERDLIIALFDAEEPPHFLGETMGSLRFYRDHCRDIRFAAVIVSDLIGHDLELEDFGIDLPGANLMLPHASETLFLLGAESRLGFSQIIEEAASQIKKLRVFPTLNRYVGNLSDHHAFERDGQPFLFLSCGQGKFYHAEKDDLDWINFDKLGRITEFTSLLIRKIDRHSERVGQRNEDTLDFEIQMIKKAVGPAFPMLMKMAGLKVPKTRNEMDRLIGRLI